MLCVFLPPIDSNLTGSFDESNKMADELYGTIFGNVESASGGVFEPAYKGERSFLRDIVTPIYNVMLKVHIGSYISDFLSSTKFSSSYREYDFFFPEK